VDGHAGDITLNENDEFYCPKEFVANSISFTHEYKMETPGKGEVCEGWETLVLPFDVEEIKHADKGAIVPFMAYKNDNGKLPFWLYGYDSDNGFVEANSIEANKPYIISMPNNERYAKKYILKGDVTFSSKNAKVMETGNLQPVTHGDNIFQPTFSFVKKKPDIKALNVDNSFVKNESSDPSGSKFIPNFRKVYPFEAYMTSISGSNVSVGIFDDLPTDMKWIPEKSRQDGRIKVYCISGQMVRILENGTEKDALHGLAPGVYVVNGHKAVVR
jgi:hypothetical protein